MSFADGEGVIRLTMSHRGVQTHSSGFYFFIKADASSGSLTSSSSMLLSLAASYIYFGLVAAGLVAKNALASVGKPEFRVHC